MNFEMVAHYIFIQKCFLTVRDVICNSSWMSEQKIEIELYEKKSTKTIVGYGQLLI